MSRMLRFRISFGQDVIARVMLIAFGAFLVAVPWLIPVLLNKFWVSLIAEIMIWSLFAASVNLLRICRFVVVWAGTLFRVWNVRSGDRRRYTGPFILASIWLRDSRLCGDCAGFRHFRGALDLALFRYHYSGVFSDILFFRGIGKAVDRWRRRHQLLIAADFLFWRRHGKLQRREFSVLLHSGDCFALLFPHASRDPKSTG